MRCPKCDSKKKLIHSEVDFDYSKTSGIAGCLLKGVDHYTCSACKFAFHDLGEETEVVDAIVDILLAQEIFPGGGLKYIREQMFQETIFQFGKRVQVEPALLKEIEDKKRANTAEITLRVQEAVIRQRAMRVSVKFEF